VLSVRVEGQNAFWTKTGSAPKRSWLDELVTWPREVRRHNNRLFLFFK